MPEPALLERMGTPWRLARGYEISTFQIFHELTDSVGSSMIRSRRCGHRWTACWPTPKRASSTGRSPTSSTPPPRVELLDHTLEPDKHRYADSGCRSTILHQCRSATDSASTPW